MTFVGVTNASGPLRLPKRELLIFDKLAVIELSLLIDTLKKYANLEPHMIDEYEWLVENDLVFEPTVDPLIALRSPEGQEIWLRLIRESLAFGQVRHMLPSQGTFKPDDLKKLSQGIHHLWARLSYEARAYAVALRLRDNMDAVSASAASRSKGRSIVLELSGGIVGSMSVRVLTDESQLSRENIDNDIIIMVPSDSPPYQQRNADESPDKTAQRSDILRVVIGRLPIPDENTPWQDILDFRRDPDTSRKLLAIREWTRSIAREGREVSSLQERLDYLLEEYRAHIALHKLKYSMSAFETLITTTAEVAESLIKFKWKAVAEAMFSIRKRKIALLEAEASAPGREVSYIIHAQSKFGVD